MTFVKFSTTEIQPLGDEMPKWVEGAILGQAMETNAKTPAVEDESTDQAVLSTVDHVEAGKDL